MHLEIARTKKSFISSFLLISVLFTFSLIAYSEDKQTTTDLLNQYISSKGYQSIIVFDASNIKQFWVDNSVFAKDDSIKIMLSQKDAKAKDSVPLKIQLANVNETQDCKIEVFSETEDLGFSILDNNSKTLSSSKKEDDFLNYSVASSTFHIENTLKYSFILKFNSKQTDILSIKRIILSFHNNKESSFLASPGKVNLSGSNIFASSAINLVDDNSFSVTGKRTIITSTKKIYTADNSLVSSVTIKNTGDAAATVYIGYKTYSQEGFLLDGRNFPKYDKILKVVSAQKGSNTIIVDAYSDWSKGCYLALNAQEDLSDIPNNTFANGTITEIKKLENGQAKITLSKPLLSDIMEGTKVRIHEAGGAYLYTNVKALQPGVEQTFSSTIKKDDLFLKYSSKAFSKGTYYVIPVILSYSVDTNQDNTVLISDYSISY